MFTYVLLCICSYLRRSDFRYTKICLPMLYYVFVPTSGEAILGTLKYAYLRMLNKTNKQTKLSQQKTLTEGGVWNSKWQLNVVTF